MKTIVIVISSFLISLNLHAQSLNYGISAVQMSPVYKPQLASAQTISDLVPGYASNWVQDYKSVELIAIKNGVAVSAMGEGHDLTSEQKSLLKAADMCSRVWIHVEYRYNNTIKGVVEDEVMDLRMTLVPEKPASFPGGEDAIMAYLKEKGVTKIAEDMDRQSRKAYIRFEVNKEGKVEDVRIELSSGVLHYDSMLMELLRSMPQWVPARDQGRAVSQTFELSIGSEGDGC